MFNSFNKVFLFFLLLLIVSFKHYGQKGYTVTLSYLPEECALGSAGLQVDSLKMSDTLTIKWSNGQTNVNSIGGLNAGDYSVQIKVNKKLDTTANFTIDKAECKIKPSNQFTPNGDNYNDVWQISSTENYPEFELFVFNKWGQQVHKQKNTYTPWDGKMGGINVADGTYYYVFYYEAGKKKHVKGDVTILR